MDSETKKTPRTLTYTFTYTFTVDDDFDGKGYLDMRIKCDPPLTFGDVARGSVIGLVYLSVEAALSELQRQLQPQAATPVTTTVQ
jgi:hypothetical protein